jgi:hypothetical protein
MAKVKLDSKQIKEFLFHKGERVGLGVAVVIMLALLFLGIRAGLTAGNAPNGQPWGSSIKEQTKQAQSKLANLPLPGLEDPGQYIPVVDLVKAEPTHSFPPLFNPAERANKKRNNPLVLPILNGKNDIQVDFIRGGILSHVSDPKEQKYDTVESGGASRPMVVMRAKRMAVIHAVFPFKDQLEEIKKALQLNHVGEVLAIPDFAPKFLGLNVTRWEVIRDAKGEIKGENPVVLYRYDAKADKTVLSTGLDEVFREGLFDEEFTSKYVDFFLPGLATPLPKLAYGDYPHRDYPPVNLPGFKVKTVSAKDGDGRFPGAVMPGMGSKKPGSMMGRPMPPGGGGAGVGAPDPRGKVGEGEGEGGGQGQPGIEGQPANRYWKELLDQALLQRFKGKYVVFDPFGQVATPGVWGGEDMPGGLFPGMPFAPPPAGMPGGRFGSGKGPAPIGGGKEGGPAPGMFGPDAAWGKTADKYLVRFFDVDLEPGKAYAYVVQVRMANPNHGKTKDVSHARLAELKEILSDRMTTPIIQVTPEYHYYAFDQKPDPAGVLKDASDHRPPYGAYVESTPVQIHVWKESTTEPQNRKEYIIADWVIAERLFTRRGEFLGRSEFMAEVPVWTAVKGATGMFEIGEVPPVGKKRVVVKGPTGIPVDTRVGSPPPLLVDFEGGKKPNAKGMPEDNAAVEMLVLGSDGRLELRNSRVDSDIATASGKQRDDRHKAWRKRLKEARDAAPPPDANPMGPKGGGNVGS